MFDLILMNTHTQYLLMNDAVKKYHAATNFVNITLNPFLLQSKESSESGFNNTTLLPKVLFIKIKITLN